jgi:hypothetical protein
VTIALTRDGLYARVDGRVYAANRDTHGRLVITSTDPDSTRMGFIDRYGVGTFTKTVTPADLDGLFRVAHEGTYRGESVAVTVNARGRVLVGTQRAEVASALELPRVDKAWWEREIGPDDPDLSIQEVRTDVPLEPTAPLSRELDRYFAQFGPDRTPNGLLRRHYTPDGHEDQVLRDVDSWKPDVHGSVQQAIVNRLESPLEEITPEQAVEFLEMVARRSYRPFSR